ncbi:MAG: hypothetical protein QM610_12205 [Chitinophagaceae bacterium]
MKIRHIPTFLFAWTLCLSLAHAQSIPQVIGYHEVVRNTSTNGLVTSKTVGVKVSILQGSASGTAVYSETQTATTNISGLYSLHIGNGSNKSGTISAIDWSTGTYYLKTEVDTAGGTSYTNTTTKQLLSLPYALYTKKATSARKSTLSDSVAGSLTTKIAISHSQIRTLDTSWGGILAYKGYVPTKTHSTGHNVAVDSVIGVINNDNKIYSYPLLEAPLTNKTYETNLWRVQGNYYWNNSGINATAKNTVNIYFKVYSIGSGVLIYSDAITVPAPNFSGSDAYPFSEFFPTVADATSAGKGYYIIISCSTANDYALNSLYYTLTDVTRVNF